jgi:anaerobic ribonucleoside-triphosphate reductase activating protein
MDVRSLINDVMNTPGITGITLSGGEPLLQAKELAVLAKAVQAAGLTVMIFTGFSKPPNNPDVHNLLKYTDMVIAGEYDRTKPGKIPLIGSSNQRVMNLTKRLPNPLTDKTIPRVEIIQNGTELSLSGFPTPEEVKEFKETFGSKSVGDYGRKLMKARPKPKVKQPTSRKRQILW